MIENGNWTTIFQKWLFCTSPFSRVMTHPMTTWWDVVSCVQQLRHTFPLKKLFEVWWSQSWYSTSSLSKPAKTPTKIEDNMHLIKFLPLLLEKIFITHLTKTLRMKREPSPWQQTKFVPDWNHFQVSCPQNLGRHFVHSISHPFQKIWTRNLQPPLLRLPGYDLVVLVNTFQYPQKPTQEPTPFSHRKFLTVIATKVPLACKIATTSSLSWGSNKSSSWTKGDVFDNHIPTNRSGGFFPVVMHPLSGR